MRNILFSWIGKTDLRASRGELEAGLVGPIADVLKEESFDDAVFLSNYEDSENTFFINWLKRTINSIPTIHYRHIKLSDPTDFDEIYLNAKNEISSFSEKCKKKIKLTYFISPGTPAMGTTWILISQMEGFTGELIKSSTKKGVQKVMLPFEIKAQYIKDLRKQVDDNITFLAQGLPPADVAFDEILSESIVMKDQKSIAGKWALTDINVLIQGETGTGKELFARAIHKAGSRREGPFQALNCGSIPPELFESELFGHEKGAFTGAIQKKIGSFERADKGTLFLDEIGEMPVYQQVKLLRVLNDKTIWRVGGTKEITVDVRLIAATNKNVIQEVREGKFREDLYYRLNVGHLNLPPLSEREGDTELIIENTMSRKLEEMNKIALLPNLRKKISSEAKSLLTNHDWPGNVRELENAIVKLLVLAGDTIEPKDVQLVLAQSVRKKPISDILNRPIGGEFSIYNILDKVKTHYLKHALIEAGGNKKKAAKLLGISNYQTLVNWCSKYNL